MSRSSFRTWKRRLATATRSRTAPSPPEAGSSSISSTANPRSFERTDPRPDRMPIVRRELRFERDLVPQRGVPRPHRLGCFDRVLHALRAALQRGQVGQPERDVLHEDVEVVVALPGGQGGMDLAGLGVDEERLDLVAVAAEERVRERAIAPVHAGPMEIDEQPRHGVEEPVAIRARAQREAQQQAPVLDRVREVLGREDGRVALRVRSPGRRRSPPAATPTRGGGARRIRARRLRAAPPSARRSVPSATRNRTRWRDGPIGSVRKTCCSSDHSASGRSQGRSSSAEAFSRRRSRGNGVESAVSVRVSSAGTS